MTQQKHVIDMTKKIIVLVCLVFEFVIFVPSNVYATENSNIVKVGWFQSDMFMEGTSDDVMKSGYCYDYLQNVSNYTKWNYEYVYGDWTELFHMLQSGEIDVLGGVSLTEERKDSMLFPDVAMGTDQYYLYKRVDDMSITNSDLSSLSGKKVGGIRDNRMTTFLNQWSEDSGIDIEIVYYDSFEAQEKDFEAGKLDLMTQTINNVLSIDGISIVAKIGEEPFYLAVAKNRADLLSELNASVTTILSIDPFILQDLQYKNYGATLTSRTMTEEEKLWLSQNPVMTVGYMDDYLPYSDQDENGQPSGLVTDVITGIIDAHGLNNELTVQYKAFADYDDMVSELRAGNVNAIFPVSGDLWSLEQDGIDASAAVISGTDSFFFKGTYQPDEVHSLAVNKHNAMELNSCKMHYPNAKINTYDSTEECLDAVINGKDNGTIINSYRTQLVTGNSKYDSLSYVQLDSEAPRCFGVNEDETELLIILNRGIRMIGTSYGIDHSYKYMENFVTYSITDFVRDNVLLIVLVLAGVAALVIGILVYYLRREKSAKEQIEKMNTELKENQVLLQKTLEDYQHADVDRRTDFLTGLRNRMDLFELIQEALSDENKQIYAMFMMDIDNFKKYNDNYGHEMGDKCLSTIGHALKEYGEKNNIIFYRYGGEELLGVLVNKTDKAEDCIAEEIVELVRQLNIVRDDLEKGKVTISLGYTCDNSRYEKMIGKADKALYFAKNNGKDRAVCDKMVE